MVTQSVWPRSAIECMFSGCLVLLPLLHFNTPPNRSELDWTGPPDSTWRRPSGRTKKKWFDQLQDESNRPTRDLWRRAVGRGHGGATTRRPSLATRQCWWWCWWCYGCSNESDVSRGMPRPMLRWRSRTVLRQRVRWRMSWRRQQTMLGNS